MTKKLIRVCLVLLALSFIKCDDDAEILTLNREFEVHEDERVTINLEGEDEAYIEIQVMDIVDSRCPSNASCVRYGEAEVKVSASGVEEVVNILDLCIGDCPNYNKGFIESDTVPVQLDGNAYKVILLGVNPYPTTQNQNDIKSALLKVITD